MRMAAFRRVLQLEAERGHENKAVVGGGLALPGNGGMPLRLEGPALHPLQGTRP